MSRAIFTSLIFVLCLLAGAVRAWNLRDVFVQGHIYFLDADCYSRMTRARLVSDGAAMVIRHHEFENWPQGTRPHTTAPMDWAIVLMKRTLDFGFSISDFGRRSLLGAQTLD